MTPPPVQYMAQKLLSLLTRFYKIILNLMGHPSIVLQQRDLPFLTPVARQLKRCHNYIQKLAQNTSDILAPKLTFTQQLQ